MIKNKLARKPPVEKILPRAIGKESLKTTPDEIIYSDRQLFSKEKFSQTFVLAEILRVVDFFENTKKIVVKSIRLNSSKRQVFDLTIPPSKRSNPSETVALFDREESRLGLIADIWRALLLAPEVSLDKERLSLKFTKKQTLVKNDRIKSAASFAKTTQTYLNKILTGVQLLDYEGKAVTPNKASFLLETTTFQINYPQIKNRQSLPRKDFLKETINFLLSLSKIKKVGQEYRIKIRNLNLLKRRIGLLQRNITPYTFGCRRHYCLFCYVQRELGVITYRPFWVRPLKEIDLYIDHYDPQTKGGLPRPAFAMQDWEPFEHPDLIKIIKKVTRAAPGEPFYIVTNGSLLTEKIIKQLSQFPQIHLQISLNSSSPKMRKKIMGGELKIAKQGIKALELCQKYHVSFDVSLVACPQWTGWKDLESSLLYADQCGPKFYIRVALPTATRYHRPDLLLSRKEIKQIINFVRKMRKKIKTPIIITVALEGENDLRAKIEGVIKNSPAKKADLRHEDIILKVNGKKVRSRTETNLLLEEIFWQTKEEKKISVKLEIQRRKKILKVDLANYLAKEKLSLKTGMGEKPVGWFGFLIPDDVDFGVFEQINQICSKQKATKPLMLTSGIMNRFWKMAISKNPKLKLPLRLEILPVKNWYFGGNVNVAGLQTVDDQIYTLKKWKEKTGQSPDVIFVSKSAFSLFGIDLKGDSIKKLEQAAGCPVFILRSRTGSY